MRLYCLDTKIRNNYVYDPQLAYSTPRHSTTIKKDLSEKKNSSNKLESDLKKFESVFFFLKTLSLTISKAQTLVDFVGDSRLPFTQIIPIYRQRKLPQSLKSVPKMSLKKYKTKFRLNVSFTLTMTLFPTGTKRNLFFFFIF